MHECPAAARCRCIERSPCGQITLALCAMALTMALAGLALGMIGAGRAASAGWTVALLALSLLAAWGVARRFVIGRMRELNQGLRLAAVFDNTVDAIVVLQSGRVLQLNPAAERLFARAQCDVAGRPGEALLPGFDWAAVTPGGQPREALVPVCGGMHIPVEVSLSRVEDAAGTLTVAVLRNISARKEVERQLVSARDGAEAARATQAAFLASMGHELRTPLNGVMGYAELLLMQDPLTEWQACAIRNIHKCGEHLLALINDLLDHAKHRAGKLELCPAELPLVEHLHATCDIVRVMAEEARLDFVCDVADDVPRRVVADGKRLRQVLLNLLGNAIKFTEAGQVMLKVRADPVDRGQARLHFEVHDTGVGLREDQYESIFEPFEQLGDAHRRTCGSGLGLAISRQLVRLMGGDIRVASTLERGTTFSFHVDVMALGDCFLTQ